MDFLKHMPVRRQTALKQTKIASKIKGMLKAYALARPMVRISMKILKAKNDKDNFIYAAKTGATVTDAAMMIFGQQILAECEWHVWSSTVAEGEEDVRPSSSISTTTPFVYTFEAFMPRKQSGGTLPKYLLS
jgi:DNA mismatch repair ATPase MutL